MNLYNLGLSGQHDNIIIRIQIGLLDYRVTRKITVPREMVRLLLLSEMLDYRGVGFQRSHCIRWHTMHVHDNH